MKKLLLLTVLFLASCTFGVGSAWGRGYCVTNATEFQGALTTAASNGEDDIIMVVQGTYGGNFTFSSSEGHGLILQGGWITDSMGICANIVVNPANTILDGGSTGGVLELTNAVGGNIEVDNFTLRNGNVSGSSGAGLWVSCNSVSGTAGNVLISNNIITGNTVTTYQGGGVYAFSSSNTGASGTVTLFNNIIAGNIASAGDGGGVYVGSESHNGPGKIITLTNNTIAGNTSGNNGGGVFFYGDGNIIYVYNNIIRENTATSSGDDIYLGGSGGAAYYGHNNNYHELAGTWNGGYSGNIDADPLFIGSGNYHLRANSPCIDTGDDGAPGISLNDIDGDDRNIDGNNDAAFTVDMGADEYYPPFKISGTTYYYSTIHEAYDFMTSGTLQIKASEFTENLVLDQNYIVLIKGGYCCNFTNNDGTYSTINGSLTIRGGTVTVENIKIK